MTRTVMVVEDDAAIRLVLRTSLQDEGYRVLEAPTAERGLLLARDHDPDVLLIDLRLPGIQGIELVRTLRRTSQVPIIIVTAQADSTEVVLGLEAGADDYVTKPFVAKELMARVGTQMRRATPLSSDENAFGDHRQLSCGSIHIDLASSLVTRDDEYVPVSRIEFFVLAELVAAKGRVLSRDYLLRKVWGYGDSGDGRVVDNLIYRLRNKVESDPANPTHLLTVRGFGYRMTDE